MKKLIVFLVAGLALSACKSKDSYVRGPAIHTQDPSIIVTPIREGATGTAQIFSNPKVDILFVIDDSQSMLPYQQRLQANVHRLVESLAQAKSLDVRIAVTQIWDDNRYSTGVVPPKCTLPDGSQHVNYVADGAALPLKLPQGDSYKTFSGRAFVSPQEPGAKEVLENSIVLGVQDLIKNKPGQCESGPEVESVLGPIHESLFSTYNKDFWRDDSLKVFMVLSDAKEGSNETAESLDTLIRAVTHAEPIGPQDKYRVYVAGMKPGTRTSSSCKPDPGFGRPAVIPDHEIAKLARLSDGEIFSICDANYGDELAKFADDIKKATLKNREYALQPVDINPNLPKDKQFKLKLGDVELKQGGLAFNSKGEQVITNGGDWAYDLQHDKVIVRGDFWNDHPGQGITISYVPVPNS